MAFLVGQKVARVWGRALAPGVPPLEKVCTVSWVGVDDAGQEVINITEYPASSTGVYIPYYHARYFRPITEKKTDISVFTRILDKLNSKQPAKV
jgi:uncharacterized Zn-finger protein